MGHFIRRFFCGYRDQNVVMCEIVITRVIELKNIFIQTRPSCDVLTYDRKYHKKVLRRICLSNHGDIIENIRYAICV